MSIKIERNKRDAIEAELKKWASKRTVKLENMHHEWDDDAHGFWLEKGDWAVEVIPENGWAYVHGYKSLAGFSTNIEDLSELQAALDRLIVASRA